MKGWLEELGEGEDLWDNLLGGYQRVDELKGGRERSEDKWTKVPRQQVRVLEGMIDKDHKDAEALGRKMFEVWKEERRLYFKERQERRRGRMGIKLERKFGCIGPKKGDGV